MRLVFMVEVELERDEGKFASRDDLGEQVRAAIEGADEGSWTGENDGQYSTSSWEVTLEEPAKRGRRG